jgi:hypothetical protein
MSSAHQWGQPGAVAVERGRQLRLPHFLLMRGALAGEYVGASGEVGMGLGAGVNVLVGGSGRSFALQPVSVEGSVAVNVTLGLSGLQLRAVY